MSERFWANVDKTPTCWLWTGPKTTAGYGEFMVRPREWVYAHRYSSELTEGPIPKGVFVLHHCDVTLCVRPDHLFRGTHQDNMNDMWAKGRGRPGRLPGELHPAARLTELAVHEIRARKLAGETSKAVARDFGITAGHVNDIYSRKSWRHVI